MNISSKYPLIDGISIAPDYCIFKDENNNIYGYGNNQYGQLGRDINDPDSTVEATNYK